MAATTKLFHYRPKTLPISTFHSPATSIHSFSSSSSPDFPDYHPSPPPPPAESPSPHSSFISDLKASLKQNQQLRNPQSQLPPHRRKPFSFASSSSSSLPNPPLKASFDEIRKNLQEFRRRTVPPPPPPELLNAAGTSPNSAPPTPISFQTLYVRNLAADNNKAEGSSTPDGPQAAAEMPFLAIKNSLNNLRAANNEGNRNGRRNFPFPRPNLKLWASEPAEKQSPILIEGTRILPLSGSEMSAVEEDEGKMRTEFFRSYTHKELGEKLRLLRPEKKGGGENWFSLAELNERLAKLREMEVRESKSREVGGVSFFELRESLKKMTDENQKSRVNTMLKIGALDQLGRTPDYMLAPPQEHLVEKYFHPDNMSESEKLKLELTKVRDEFKMSESDCGSARVQVAQLTTKIKHLAKVLHKKDKHSRKGLNDMIQRRKKLLKYMRRTDWDSYCFVLSKLGLRDNPGYNN